MVARAVPLAIAAQGSVEPKAKFMAGQDCMKAAQDDMSNMTRAEMLELRQEASRMRTRKQEDIAARVDSLQAQTQDILRAEAEDKAEHGIRNHVDDVRLDDQRAQDICDLLENEPFTTLQYNDLATSRAPAPPLANEVIAFNNKIEELGEPPRLGTPSWAKHVCRRRDNFHGVVLAQVGDDGPPEYWLVMFAKLSPTQQVNLLKLRPRPVLNFDDAANEDALGMPYGHISFEYLPPEFATENDVDFAEDDLMCIQGLRFQGGHASTSHGLVPFDVFLSRSLAADGPPEDDTRAIPKKRPKFSHEVRQALLQEHPWLTEEDLQPKQKVARRREVGGMCRTAADLDPEAKSDDSSSGSDDGAGHELADGDLPEEAGAFDMHIVDEEGGMDELRGMREGWAWDGEDLLPFYTHVLGGRWLLRERGLAADAVSGFARAWAKDWCALYKWPRSMRFTYEKYGKPQAHELAREFCRRGTYFFMLWYDSPDTDEEFVYTEDHIRSYEEPIEFVDFMLGEPDASAAFDKGMEVRRIRPRLGPSEGA